jgi:hypothetical protein
MRSSSTILRQFIVRAKRRCNTGQQVAKMSTFSKIVYVAPGGSSRPSGLKGFTNT